TKGNKWCTRLDRRVRVIDDDRLFRLKGSFYELGLLSIAVPIVAKAVFADMLVRICKTGTEEGTLSGTLYADEDNQFCTQNLHLKVQIATYVAQQPFYMRTCRMRIYRDTLSYAYFTISARFVTQNDHKRR